MKTENSVITIDFEFSYTKQEEKLRVIILEKLPLPKWFNAKERSVVELSPGAIGGNHKHPRAEAFFALQGKPEFHWLDGAGKKHQESMDRVEGKFKLFIVPAFVPHAVINRSDEEATMVEFATDAQHDVVPVEVI